MATEPATGILQPSERWGRYPEPEPPGIGGRIRQQAAYAGCIGGAVALNLALLARGAGVEAAREKVRRGAAWYLRFLAARNFVHTHFEDFDADSFSGGALLCANHPSILDAVCLFAAVPQLDCVIGSGPMRSPLFALPARLARYVPGDGALRMVKECRRRMAAGATVLVFPEGTRTAGGALGRFREGPFLAAMAAGAPVRTVFIETNSLFLGKGFRFYRNTPAPITMRISAGDVFHAGPGDDARAMAKRVEDYFRARLVREPNRITRTDA
jgi:1-acyl-sn-glycerol-3-phosphate acyltransferase